MKLHAIIACLVVLAVSVRAGLRETYLNFLSNHMAMCANELGMSQSDVDAISKMSQLTDPKKEGCLSACILKKLNIINDGIISLDNIRSLVDTIQPDSPEEAERVKATAIECANQYSGKISDDCELGMHTLNCGISALGI